MFLIIIPRRLSSQQGNSRLGRDSETGIKFIIQWYADPPPERRSVHHILTQSLKVLVNPDLLSESRNNVPLFHNISSFSADKADTYRQNFQAQDSKTTGIFVTFFFFL